MGAGTWNEHSNDDQESVLSNISQPSWAKAASKFVGIETDEDIVQDSDQKIRLVERLQKEMTAAAARLEFERAAKIRDRIIQLEKEIYN